MQPQCPAWPNGLACK